MCWLHPGNVVILLHSITVSVTHCHSLSLIVTHCHDIVMTLSLIAIHVVNDNIHENTTRCCCIKSWWTVCMFPSTECWIHPLSVEYRSAMCRQANLKIDWHKRLSRWYISIEIQTKITKFSSVISCWLRSFALTQASSQFLSFQAMRIPILCCGLWLPPIRLSSSFPSKWKSKFVSFLFGFLVYSPLGKIT